MNEVKQTDNKQFWNRFAGVYTRFVSGGKKANRSYEEMVNQICRYLDKDKIVLELGAGPGLLSVCIAPRCKSLEATDFSEEMIAEAKKKHHSSELHFSVQDATNLPYADETFDAVVIANTLHIMPEPDPAMENIRRVLKKNGILLCPTFTHETTHRGLKERLMELAGFRTYHRWNSAEYVQFIKKHGFDIIEVRMIYGNSFPITFIAALRKSFS